METEAAEHSSLDLTRDFAQSLEEPIEFCRFYNFLLVEELALVDNYEELHIGRCSIIGRLRQNETGDFLLENVHLPNLPKQLSLPEGALNIRLIDHKIEKLRNGSYCEICGEVALIHESDKHQIHPKLLTTQNFQTNLRRFTTSEERQRYLQCIQSLYKVAIKLDFVYEIDRAEDLTRQLKDIAANICEYAEVAKENSWLEYWRLEGSEIVLSTWNNKYKDYICKTVEVADNLEEEQVKVKEATENLDNTDTLSWQQLWIENGAEVYVELYEKFEQVYSSYFWALKNSLTEQNEINEIQKEFHNELETELEQLKLAGLPTSFGRKSRKSKNKKSRKRSEEENPPQDFVELIENVYNTDNDDSEEYFSAFDTTDNDDEEGDVYKMPPTTNKNLSQSIDNELHKTQKNAISKSKNNRKLRNLPDFMLKEKGLQKYWRQRFSLFSRFDEGIKLDRESWFSVTPEKVAKHIAQRLSTFDVIVDGFCGSGGNTIQFAMTCKKVIAIDIDPEKIEMAKHNATIYGVADKIEFIVGDFLELSEMHNFEADAVFLSPPWGGPEYKTMLKYNIETCLEPVSATELMKKARSISNNIAFFLPRNADIKQIIKLAGIGSACEVEHNYLDTRVVGLTAFYGDCVSKK